MPNLLKKNDAQEHLDILDALRGFAALSVCIWHFTGKVLPKLNVASLYNIFSWGWAGVTVFFVISGFIIPHIMYKSNYRVNKFGRFMGKRFIRIAPPSYIILTLILLQWWFGEHIYKSNNFNFSHLTVSEIVSNFLYIAPFLNHDWINAVFWTLTQEFQFYILIGITFTFSFKNIYTFLIFSIAVALLFYIPIPQYEFFGKYGSIFLIGGLTALFKNKKINTPIFLAALVFLTSIVYFQNYIGNGIINALFSFSTALIIAFIKFKNIIATFLGKISYSLYLIHILVAPIYELIFIKLFNPQSDTNKILIQIIILLLTVASAYLYSVTIEKYFIKLADKIFPTKKIEIKKSIH